MKIYIIAEAGVNHNGSLANALELVKTAHNAGADAVKFQTFKAGKLVSPTALQADYQRANTKTADTQYQMLKKLELTQDDFIKIKDYCAELGIEFLSTPFDRESGDFLLNLGIKKIKIPSGEITNKRYLQWAAKTGLPVILSTGMADLCDVKRAMDVLLADMDKTSITLLHCTTEYPAPYNEINLKAIQTLAQEFGVSAGFSDHSAGIEIALAAAALGAQVIEKHFTLSRDMQGPDHKASLEPCELKAMISAIRNIETALGTGVKEPAPSEIKNIAIARKSLHAARDLNPGDIIKESDLLLQRPAAGLSPMEIDSVIGKKVKTRIAAGAPLTGEDI